MFEKFGGSTAVSDGRSISERLPRHAVSDPTFANRTCPHLSSNTFSPQSILRIDVSVAVLFSSIYFRFSSLLGDGFRRVYQISFQAGCTFVTLIHSKVSTPTLAKFGMGEGMDEQPSEFQIKKTTSTIVRYLKVSDCVRRRTLFFK